MSGKIIIAMGTGSKIRCGWKQEAKEMVFANLQKSSEILLAQVQDLKIPLSW